MFGTNSVTVIGNHGIESIQVVNMEMKSYFNGFPFEVMENDSNYLQKGEKILSLLRKRQSGRRGVFGSEKDPMLELLKPSWERTQVAVSKKICEQLRQKFLTDMEEQEKDSAEICAELALKLLPGVSISFDESAKIKHLMEVVCGVNVRYILRLNAKDVSIYTSVDIPHIKKSYARGVKVRGDRGAYEKVVSFNILLAEYYIRGYILRLLRRIRQEADSFEKYLQVPAIGKLVEKYASGIPRPFSREAIRNIPTQGIRDICLVLLYPEDELAPQAMQDIAGYAVNTCLIYLKLDYSMRRREHRMERQIFGDYAHSYETKKNIPYKCVRAMENSKFNRYFGYVEFDEECDLHLMEELSREYRALANELGLRKHAEVSVRFRKLGHHKASGLYYPGLKCLCVDVRYPSAMMHEVGHMLDYELGHVSDTYDFVAIRERYTELMHRFAKNCDEAIAKRLNGNSKYNLSYYTIPTEIFARCFEMYLTRHRAIDNSLCKPIGIGYPEDEKLDNLIFPYFDDLLKKYKEEKNVEPE